MASIHIENEVREADPRKTFFTRCLSLGYDLAIFLLASGAWFRRGVPAMCRQAIQGRSGYDTENCHGLHDAGCRWHADLD